MSFNSLDAQRDAAESYIRSQAGAGWVCLPDRFDDGGFTGANTDRPAFQRLMAAIEAGRIDCVVVYKIDRLSRSLADFARMMEVFEKRGVALVSVTQAFRTNDSMGRLTLNVLLSFAQFEREVIGERIRDKIGAQRRRGMWAGGKPVLGYDIDRTGPSPRLVVNPEEAERVRAIFDLYMELGGLLPVVTELRRRGWCAKAWTTKAGVQRGGQPFDKGNLHLLLTNPIVTGMIVHKGEVHDGVHEAIVDAATFAKVQSQLKANARAKSSFGMATATGALLRGLLRCKACDAAMTHAITRRGTRAYRYYRCTKACRHGAASCPSGSLPGAEIERFVVEQVKETLKRPEFARAALKEAKLMAKGGGGSGGSGGGSGTDGTGTIDLASIRAAIADIDALWPTLMPTEQFQLVHLLLERVEYDAATSSIALSFRDGVVAGHIPRSTEVAAQSSAAASGAVAKSTATEVAA
ncbi:MAG: recombinase family protein [Phycisphaeraceae bacterium]|nr:recombinase family protein [Phycisphaeraceae bacterium]